MLSLTYAGIYTMLLSNLLRLVGVEVAEGEARQLVETVLNVVAGVGTVVGGIMGIIGRHRKGGVNWLGTRAAQEEPTRQP